MEEYKFGASKNNIKKAVWQFIVDHGIKTDGKVMLIKFSTTGFGDLWRRIEARGNGLYRSEEDNMREQGARRYEENLKKLSFFMKYHCIRTKRCQEIDTGKNYADKFLLFIYRKVRDRLFGK